MQNSILFIHKKRHIILPFIFNELFLDKNYFVANFLIKLLTEQKINILGFNLDLFMKVRHLFSLM